MGRKEEYKLQNESYMESLRTEGDIKELPCGILYRVLEEGTLTSGGLLPIVWNIARSPPRYAV